MMRFCMPFLLVAVLCECVISDDQLAPTNAHVGFVLGDAFFSIDVTSESMTDMSLELSNNDDPGGRDGGGGTLTFEYRYPPVSFRPANPVFLGFSRISITDLSDEDIRIVTRVVDYSEAEAERLRNEAGEYKWHRDDKDAITRVAVVDKNFNFESHQLFQRYNEDWMRSVNDEYAINDPRIRVLVFPRKYQPHNVSLEAFVDDWRFAAKAAPLRVRLPTVTTIEFPTSRILEPLEVSFGDIAIVSEPLRSAVDASRMTRLNSSIYVATQQAGVQRYRFVLGRNLKRQLSIEQMYPQN